MTVNKKISTQILARIAEFAGIERIIKALLWLSVLPETWFISSKARYLHRNNRHEEAQKLLLSLCKKQDKTTALQLHVLMGLYQPNSTENSEILSALEKLRQQLIALEPKNKLEKYRKIRTLIKCFEFEQAKTAFYRYRSDLDEEWVAALQSYFDVLHAVGSELVRISPQAIQNTLQTASCSEDKSSIIFYLPPSMAKLELCPKSNPAFYSETISLFQNLYNAIPKSDFNIIPKIQYSWRHINECDDQSTIVSYHTISDLGKRLHVKESAFAHQFTIDKRGFAGWHSTAEKDLVSFLKESSQLDEAYISNRFREISEFYVNNNVSKYAQHSIDQTLDSFSQNYYFLALQVTNDVVAKLSYLKVAELLDQTVKICTENGCPLIIKRHPKCQSSEIERALKHYRKFDNICISNASVHTLLANCKAVITVNSGVGMEALLHKKTVISSGKSDYSLIAQEVHTRTELLQRIENFQATDEKLIERFIVWYFDKHLFSPDDHFKFARLWQQIHQGTL